jgi:hypothetical protein
MLAHLQSKHSEQLSGEGPKTYRNKTSWVWHHFEETADGIKAKCKYCHKYLSKDTQAMGNHLKSKHNLKAQGSTTGLAGIVKFCHYTFIIPFKLDTN